MVIWAVAAEERALLLRPTRRVWECVGVGVGDGDGDGDGNRRRRFWRALAAVPLMASFFFSSLLACKLSSFFFFLSLWLWILLVVVLLCELGPRVGPNENGLSNGNVQFEPFQSRAMLVTPSRILNF